MRRALPSVTPQDSRGPRRSTMSSTWISSAMHQKSPAFPWSICTSSDFGNIRYKARGVEACTSTPQFPGLPGNRYSTVSR